MSGKLSTFPAIKGYGYNNWTENLIKMKTILRFVYLEKFSFHDDELSNQPESFRT